MEYRNDDSVLRSITDKLMEPQAPVTKYWEVELELKRTFHGHFHAETKEYAEQMAVEYFERRFYEHDDEEVVRVFAEESRDG